MLKSSQDKQQDELEGLLAGMKKGLKQKWLLVMILIFYHILIIIFYASIALLTILQKQDLVDRYFELSQALKAIDLRAHPKIKKYTAEHTGIITECNLVRHLLQVFFDLKNLTLKNKRKIINLY